MSLFKVSERIRHGLRRRLGKSLRQPGDQPDGTGIPTYLPIRPANPNLILRSLFDPLGTDKGWYADVYEILLRPYRHAYRDVLEIGIGTLVPSANATMHGYAPCNYRPGASLLAWREFFPRAEILGLDIQPDSQFTDDRIRTILCDSTDSKAVRAMLGDAPRFNLIVDDGSHKAQDQLATLRNCFALLRTSGFYFIEDVGENSELYHSPSLVEPFIEGSPYFAVADSNGSARWKLIVIQRLD